jgi:hypothetical protein
MKTFGVSMVSFQSFPERGRAVPDSRETTHNRCRLWKADCQGSRAFRGIQPPEIPQHCGFSANGDIAALLRKGAVFGRFYGYVVSDALAL